MGKAKWGGVCAITIVLIIVIAFMIANFSSSALGVNQEVDEQGNIVLRELYPCPTSPNCVCSMCLNTTEHYIPPLAMGLFVSDDPINEVKNVIEDMIRTHIVYSDRHYLSSVFVAKIFRFRDDVEFLYYAEEKEVVHVRSRSRVGYGDMGVNRARVEEIRTRLEEKKSKSLN